MHWPSALWKTVLFWTLRCRGRHHSRSYDSPDCGCDALHFVRRNSHSRNGHNYFHRIDHYWLPFYHEQHIHTMSVWYIFHHFECDGDASVSISLHSDRMSLIHNYSHKYRWSRKVIANVPSAWPQWFDSMIYIDAIRLHWYIDVWYLCYAIPF